VCERVEALADSPDPDDQARADAMQVKFRYLVEIIDLDDLDRGVQVWVTTEAMINKLNAIRWNAEWCDKLAPLSIRPITFTRRLEWRDMLDPVLNRPITFTRQGKGPASRLSAPRLLPYMGMPYPGWQEELRNLDDYLTPKPYREQQRIYEGDNGRAGNGAKSRSATEGLATQDV
jgi:hypothetical protein